MVYALIIWHFFQSQNTNSKRISCTMLPPKNGLNNLFTNIQTINKSHVQLFPKGRNPNFYGLDCLIFMEKNPKEQKANSRTWDHLVPFPDSRSHKERSNKVDRPSNWGKL